jgi:hypothetical protein
VPTLPFIKTGLLRTKAGVPVVAELPLSLWPSRRSVFEAGAHYDHEAEAPLEYADELETPNLALDVEGVTYMVIEVFRHELLPHVTMTLRESRPGG